METKVQYICRKCNTIYYVKPVNEFNNKKEEVAKAAKAAKKAHKCPWMKG